MAGQIHDLSQLQNLCRRDSSGYREEFLMQYSHFKQQLKIYALKPSANCKAFLNQINFVSHVASCYKEETKQLGNELAELLEGKASNMPAELRLGLLKALILLRNRKLYSPIDLIALCFKLIPIQDKPMRQLIYSHIVNDIKNSNAKKHDPKMNNALQNLMFENISDPNELVARKTLDILVHLYNKKIWVDAKTVNAIGQAVFHKDSKMMTAAIEFFLGTSEPVEESSDEEDNTQIGPEKQKLLHKLHCGSKNTRSKERKIQAALSRLKKEKKEKKQRSEGNFAAIDLIWDPSSYAEKVFKRLRSSKDSMEVKLVMMNFLSRLIGTHQLIMDNFYPFMQKYMQSKQQNISYILAVVVQACHSLVPPELLQPVVRTLADNFVSDKCSPEVVQIGYLCDDPQTEICKRCPFAISEDLLQDLAQYKKFRDKGVVVAARSLINLFREINPGMLQKKDRGKDHDISNQPLQYGQVPVSEGVEGIELLEADKEIKKKLNNQDDSNEWELDSNKSDNSGEWITIPSDGEDFIKVGNSDGEAENNNENGKQEEQESENGEWEWMSVEEEEENSEDGEEWETIDENEIENMEDQQQSDLEKDEKKEIEEHENGGVQVESIPSQNETPPPQNKPKLDQVTILSPKDLERLKELKEKHKELIQKNKRWREVDAGEVVSADLIEGARKRAKRTLEERLSTVMAGREDRPDYRGGHKKTKAGGTSNAEKQRNKPFMLVKNSRMLREKKRQSSKQKILTLRKHVQTMRKQKGV